MGTTNAYHRKQQIELCDLVTPSLPPRYRSLRLSSLWTDQGIFERLSICLGLGLSRFCANMALRPTENLLPERHTEACGSLNKVHCSRWELYRKVTQLLCTFICLVKL
ncbi:hypothetical protein TNIN_367651 [Trichonephila inaurata madagascariensis]|uniref:Uncharacterized protein n=1 Tax=Trichonephila inaurata madagascariensis TaxID=2747483 RepID=A0A8X6X3W4_9ARAC|nr:hypothetical protein TNIN_367651 [Trichonephila inaurata madagascariensis]